MERDADLDVARQVLPFYKELLESEGMADGGIITDERRQRIYGQALGMVRGKAAENAYLEEQGLTGGSTPWRPGQTGPPGAEGVAPGQAGPPGAAPQRDPNIPPPGPEQRDGAMAPGAADETRQQQDNMVANIVDPTAQQAATRLMQIRREIEDAGMGPNEMPDELVNEMRELSAVLRERQQEGGIPFGQLERNVDRERARRARDAGNPELVPQWILDEEEAARIASIFSSVSSTQAQPQGAI